MSELAVHQDVFQAVADATRREIIHLLADRSLSIAAIAANFPISRTAVNKHLHVLEGAGLVSCCRVGRETRYQLQAAPLQEVQQWVSNYERYWDDHLDALREYVEKNEE
jgi:DNA-binding transcriptional ArsR family regulator